MTEKLENDLGSVTCSNEAGRVVERYDPDCLLQWLISAHPAVGLEGRKGTYPDWSAVHHGLISRLDCTGMMEDHDHALELFDRYRWCQFGIEAAEDEAEGMGRTFGWCFCPSN